MWVLRGGFLQYECSLNCITVNIMLSFNIVTFVNSFHFKALDRPMLPRGDVNSHSPVKYTSGTSRPAF